MLKGQTSIQRIMGKLIGESQKEGSDLKVQLRKEKDAALEALSAREQAQRTVETLKMELESSKLYIERSEQMIKTWEEDAKGKEKNLVASRARVLELEEDNQKLVLENKSLQSRLTQQEAASGENIQSKTAVEIEKAKFVKLQTLSLS